MSAATCGCGTYGSQSRISLRSSGLRCSDLSSIDVGWVEPRETHHLHEMQLMGIAEFIIGRECAPGCARNDVELQARPRFTGSPTGPALPAVLRDDTPPTDCLRSTEVPAAPCGSDRTRMDTLCGSGIRWAG